MTIPYDVFMKHAAKVCKNPMLDTVDRHQILKGIKHVENGDLIVTDSHRLYRLKTAHDRVDGAVISPKGKILDGEYPSVSRLIPSNDPDQQVVLNTSELLEAADAIYSVGSVLDKVPRLELAEDLIRYDSIHVKYQRQVSVIFDYRMFLNAKYVLDAVKLLKAAGCETTTIGFYGRMRPITLVNEDESLLILILPIRKY